MPDTFIRADRCFLFADADAGSRKLTECIWGDWARDDGDAGDGWRKVRTRGRSGFMPADCVGGEKLLEINFVDVGQGDGVFVVTPDDRFLVIDAGEQDNMHRFLSWRFNLRNNDFVIPLDVVVSHADADHYRGMQAIVENERFDVQRLFHNGIVERVSSAADPANPFAVADGDARLTTLGWQDRHDGETYLLEVLSDRAAVERLFEDSARAGRKWYPELMVAALRKGSEIHGLAVPPDLAERLVPGYGGGDLTLRVLGPVLMEHPNPDRGGASCLPWFGSRSGLGETKNGHSVVLRLQYRDVSVLLGGDLNSKSETYLQERWGNEAANLFHVDIAKSCHHGSGDFTEEFVELVNAAATVISSGDDESHAHPRPDTLGALGKYSRGRRPLLFSTELARSTKELIKKPHELRHQIRELAERLDEEEDAVKKGNLQAKLDDALDSIERSVSVYGMITLRTDGERVLMAQKLEAPRPNGQKWDVHVLEQVDGVLTYEPGD